MKIENLQPPDELIDDIVEKIKRSPIMRFDPILVGIDSGGVIVGRALYEKLSLRTPFGILSNAEGNSRKAMTLGFDDIAPITLEGRQILLVDDTVHTGKTLLSALNALFRFGEPSLVTLACLLEQNTHQLPIKADIVGQSIHQENSFSHIHVVDKGGELSFHVSKNLDIQ